MTRKQTSAKVSKLAAQYLAMTEAEFLSANDSSVYRSMALLKDIRTLAASCLSQDEVKGDSPAQRRKKAAIKAEYPELTDVDIVDLMAGKVVIKTGKPIGKNTVPTMKMPKRVKP